MSFSFMRAPAEGEALRGELLGRDAGAKNLLGRATVVTERPFLAVKAWTPCVLVVVLVLSSDVLKFIKR